MTFAFLKDNGKFVAHTPISMASEPLNDLAEPKKWSDAVTKKYVNDLIADNVGAGNSGGGGSPFFKENGNYQATDTNNKVFKKLLNRYTPSEPFEAATKKYVDEKNGKPTSLVLAESRGGLVQDSFQFAIRGVAPDSRGGCFMPVSGRLVKVAMKVMSPPANPVRISVTLNGEEKGDLRHKLIYNVPDVTHKPSFLPLEVNIGDLF